MKNMKPQSPHTTVNMNRPTSNLAAFMAAMIGLFVAGWPATGASVYWDPSHNHTGGPGTWDTTTANWATTAGGNTFVAWNNANNDLARISMKDTETLASDITAIGIEAYNLTGYGNTVITSPVNGNGDYLYTLTIGSSGINYSGGWWGWTIRANVNLTANQSWAASGNGDGYLYGKLSGSSTLRVASTPLHFLGDGSGFTGPITHDLGTIYYGHANALGSTGTAGNWLWEGVNGAIGIVAEGGARTIPNPITTQSGYGISGITLGGTNDLTFTGPVTLSRGGTWDFNVTNTGNTRFSNTIASTNTNVQKSGGGVLIFAGNNSYTGTTTVNAGTLLVNGTTSGQGNYTVASGGTLGGTGTIGIGSNTVTIQSGGKLAPGASIGILTVTGNVDFQNNAVYLWDADGNVAAPNNADLLALNGNITFEGNTSLKLANWNGDPTGDTFTLFTFTGSLIGTPTWSIDTSGTGWTGGAVNVGSHAITLTGLVPEPASLSLLVLGGALCLRRRRGCSRDRFVA